MLDELITKGEHGNVEFKERLDSKVHLSDSKRKHLATQMKYRLEQGNGEAIYVIGVTDSGKPVGLDKLEFEETLNVLRVIAAENNAKIKQVEKYAVNGKIIGKVTIRKVVKGKVNVIVATAGHVDSGKSTLLGSLISGMPDDGAGKTRIFLDTLPHEIQRGLSADLSYALYGFKDGKPIKLKNPLDKKERAKLVEEAEKIVSFVDTVGHEPWLRTTIRGLVGQNIDYALLTVGVDSGVTRITKEHLGLLMAMNIPTVIVLTKIDRFDEQKVQEVEEEVESLLKYIGKIPIKIKSKEDVTLVLDKLDVVVPMLRVSSVTLEGFELLDYLLMLLPPRERKLEEPFLMYIDKVYNVKGVGTVVSGTVKQGKLEAGKELLLGPMNDGRFVKVKATSIQTHYHSLDEAEAGFVIGIAIRGVKHEAVKRGMILCEPSLNPKPVRSFEAEIMVLTHPTVIKSGYEPVVHLATVAETVKLECLDKEYLKAGETGRVRMIFKFRPYYIEPNTRFVFREGKTKGIGKVLKVFYG